MCYQVRSIAMKFNVAQRKLWIIAGYRIPYCAVGQLAKRRIKSFQHATRTVVTLITIVTAATLSAQDESTELKVRLSEVDQEEAATAMLTRYFDQKTREITVRCFDNILTLEDWENEKEKRRLELLEMLGLQPLPARTNLNPVITGGAEAEGVVVENLYFESSPGLFVTGNLYRPKEQSGPLPAVLYVCGHGKVKKDGISYGNKTHYQHHGAWFARNGYVCLTIDTIQLGEIEGIHHGTYREKMWWWNNRGYTPAGVEAWNSMRSIDYLQTRPEVDPDRIGVTGRSGGGAYSWWIAAIDKRIKAAVPVAGITSLKNHVVDGCIEGHCDCMFMVNTYRWDYPMVAALVAPRALLISNTDKDRIFPLDGVVDVHQKVAKIYELYDAPEKLGLHITEGPHQDTQELRIHAFRWLNRYLRGTDELIDVPATKLFTPEQLKVFTSTPDEEKVTTIHESFVPLVDDQSLPKTLDELNSRKERWKSNLLAKTFAGWDQGRETYEPESIRVTQRDGIKIEQLEYKSDEPFQLQIFRLSLENPRTEKTIIRVLNHDDWKRYKTILEPPSSENQASDLSNFAAIREQLQNQHLIIFSPRGIGPNQWTADEKTQTHIRRRFMQLGQTLAGMQIYDLITAFRVVRGLPEFQCKEVHLEASGAAAHWTLFASIFESGFDSLTTENLPVSHRYSPDLLNVSRVVTLPQVALLAASCNQHLKMKLSDQSAADHWQALLKESQIASDLISLGKP